ncbi:MAG: hypothetical protein DDT20_01326 [Firmicutes bacterium]|nr:hypothetical protein [Bacillota bacterium]
MQRIRIISNNPLVALSADDYFVPAESVVPVLEEVRDLVHLGHHLLTHPLAGSLKPNENPYRSVVVTKETLGVDYQSVQLAEGALAVARRMLTERPYRAWSDAVRADLQRLDKTLLASALDSNEFPHGWKFRFG